MPPMLRIFCLFLLLSTGALAQWGDPGNFGEQPEKPAVTAELVAAGESLQPQGRTWLGLKLTMAEKWTTYWRNAGDVGGPTSVEWTLPEGLSAGPLQWPTPQRKVYESEGTGTIVSYAYSDEVILPIRLEVGALEPGSTVTLQADVSWYQCSDTTCVPTSDKLTLQLPVAANEPAAGEHAEAIARYRDKLPVPAPETDYRVSGAVDGSTLALKLQGPSRPEGVRYIPAHNYLIVDDPDAPGDASVGKIESGVVAVDRFAKVGQELALFSITLGDTPAEGFRIGVLANNQPRRPDRIEHLNNLPATIRLGVTRDGRAVDALDSGRVRLDRAGDGLGLGDWYFFDVVGAKPGDVLTVHATNHPDSAHRVRNKNIPFAAQVLGGVTFDPLPRP